MNRAEITRLVDEFIDNILIEYEPEEIEEAAEQLRTIVNDYLDNTIQMQAALTERLKK